MNFNAFKKYVSISTKSIYKEFFQEHREKIKIKKENLVVKNLIKISEAVIDLSNKKGFTTISVRDISIKANLSIGALYTYFPSKDELLSMIQQQSMRTVVKVLVEQLIGIDDPRIKLQQAIYTHLYLSEIMYPWFYFSYMEIGRAHV